MGTNHKLVNVNL